MSAGDLPRGAAEKENRRLIDAFISVISET